MIVAAMSAALIAILAQFTIPFPMVPNTAQPFAIGLVATILGKRWGTTATSIYVLMGAIGLPVFANMSGGIGIIFGNTGGYIWGFIVAPFVIGLYMSKTGDSIVHAIIANLIGTFIILGMGVTYLSFMMGHPPLAALLPAGLGGFTFLITNPLQASAAAILGVRVRKALRSAKLLDEQESKQVA